MNKSLDTYEWVTALTWIVMAHIRRTPSLGALCIARANPVWVSHGTRMNKWVMAHIHMSHGTHMDDSRHTYDDMRYSFSRCTLHCSSKSHTNESRHIWLSHGTRTNESRHIYEWVTAYIWQQSYDALLLWARLALLEQVPYGQATAHIWISHGTHMKAHIWMSNNTYMTHSFSRRALHCSSKPRRSSHTWFSLFSPWLTLSARLSCVTWLVH